MRIAFIIVVCLFATSSQEKNGFVTPIHRIQFELCLARGYSESGNEERAMPKKVSHFSPTTRIVRNLLNRLFDSFDLKWSFWMFGIRWGACVRPSRVSNLFLPVTQFSWWGVFSVQSYVFSLVRPKERNPNSASLASNPQTSTSGIKRYCLSCLHYNSCQYTVVESTMGGKDPDCRLR